MKHGDVQDHPCTLKLHVEAKNAATVKGARRVGEILAAALETLSRNGHSGLTLDSVARQVGIQKGNLQYYFPTRAHLLRAVFARQIEQHGRDWLSARGGPETDAIDRLKRLIAFELDVNRNQEFIAQVRERWSLENRDDSARDLTNRWYAWVTEQYAHLIAEIRPELDDQSCHQLAMIIYAMLVGSAPYFGSRGAVPQRTGNLPRQMENAVLQLVLNFS